MILGKQYGIHSVDGLLGRLAKSRLAVVRISGAPGQELCTGFFITPSHIIAPAFAFRPGFRSVLVECFRDGKRIWQQTIAAPFELLKAAPDTTPAMWKQPDPLLAVLRVAPRPARPLPTRGFTPDDGEHDGVLELGFDAPDAGQFVAVVQYVARSKVQRVSFGTLRSTEGDVLEYDADTDVGSSGGPVLDANWRVIGMHFASSAPTNANRAISRAAIVGALRQSRDWKKIQDRHRIADVAAAAEKISVEPPRPKERPDELLVSAAVTAWINPRALADAEKKALRRYVADTKAQQWTLRSSERARILANAGSLAELRKVRKLNGARPEDVTQTVINRILAGPPYDLTELGEEMLTVWIPASRWFSGVDKRIPTPAQVTRVLERIRMRTRLDAIAGADFRGRTPELEFMQQWWRRSENPLSITGIGGVGKSALIARFAASKLPPRTLLLWLDFDRADLAPDDAPSVLAAISDQAAVQLDRFQAPETNPEEWEKYATELGERLQTAVPRRAAALLVLDSFEAAQYRAKYQELWPVLERLVGSFPRLRLIVSGRAEVPELELGGHHAESLHLGGLERTDARRWLKKHGVNDPDVLRKVADAAAGIPLILRLAVQLLERGGKVEKLPEELSTEIRIGYLYGRILDRVQNPEIKQVARGALVLRRLTEEMVEPVLGGLVEMPEGEISKWFPDLTREMALVEGSGVLRLRSEVRRGALIMLEREDAALVKSVDQRAADWYASQDTTDPEIAAELVYHRLRLGDLRGAGDAWRDGCGRFLTDTAKELAPKSRKWLDARLGVAEASTADTQFGLEMEAAERIRSARGRGNVRAAGGILSEREEFTDNSPLVFQAAYERWVSGDPDLALDILNGAGVATGTVARDRAVLRAALAARTDDRVNADSLLASVQDEKDWSDRPLPLLCATAVRAARLRLTVDLDGECAVIENPKVLPASFRAMSTLDVLLPRLTSIVSEPEFAVEALGDYQWVDLEKPEEIGPTLERLRTAESEAEFLHLGRRRMEHEWREKGLWAAAQDWSSDRVTPPVAALLVKSWWRWTLLSSSSFLWDACLLALSPEQSALGASVIGTLALFGFQRSVASGRAGLEFGSQDLGPLGRVVMWTSSEEQLRVDESRWPSVRNVLEKGIDPSLDWDSMVRADVLASAGRTSMTFIGDLKGLSDQARSIIIHLMTPDPLEQLVHDLAGRSTS